MAISGKFTPLTKNGGEVFIRTICKPSSTDHIIGSPTYAMPFTDPPVKKVWTSASPDHNGNPITNDGMLAEALIAWYNRYCDEYKMDANILVAQTYIESGFKVWNYAGKDSTASGLTQFIRRTVHDVVVRNRFSIGEPFSTAEIGRITKDWIGDPNDMNGYIVGNQAAKDNRVTLHQNITDNPEIMIKAQCKYMKFISGRCKGVASSTLFGYNRGDSLAKPSYSESIRLATNHRSGYEREGVNYIYKIFKLLFNHFEYHHLEMNKDPEKDFDEFAAQVAESEFRG